MMSKNIMRKELAEDKSISETVKQVLCPKRELPAEQGFFTKVSEVFNYL